MKLALGVLAHNEEREIGATLRSLLGQSILADPGIETQIVVVANGCSDGTAAAAREAIGAASRPLSSPPAAVFEVEEAGKANAWNFFVHKASAPDTDYFVLLDADIEFADAETIARLIAWLEANPDVQIAPDQPVKKFAAGGGLLRPLIRALQKSGGDDDHALSGQLYAARAAALRSVVMPVKLVVEDGFLRAMTLTRCFTELENLQRIVRAPGARHFYKPYESIAGIWRYERRQAAGTAINRFLYDEFRRWRVAGLDVTDEIRRRNDAERDWLARLIAERVKRTGAIAVPKNYVLRRLRRGKNWSLKRIALAPVIAAAVLFDAAVALAASQSLRRGADTHWDAIRSA